MIVTPRIAIRIALIVIAAVILQLSFFSYLSILGATPYLVPVVIVSLGLLGGGVVGAVCGFAAGVLIDSLLLQTLGVSSLVLLSIGYLAGRYREGFEIRNGIVPALLAGGFTLLGAAGFAAIELMLGVDAPVSLLVVREILVQGLLAVVLGVRRLPAGAPRARPRAGRLQALDPVARARAPATAADAAQPQRRALGAGAAPPRPASSGPRRRGLMGSDWRGPPMPDKFALRVAILGGIGLVAFAIIFLRLWYLEVLSGDQYLAQAQNNQVREFTVQAPRGKVLDRHGELLVDNRTALALQVKPTDLPQSQARRARLFARVGEVAGLRPKQIRNAIRAEAKECSACPATLRRDVPYDTVYFLRENQERFPGVSVERVYVRRYPQGSLAAHLLGYAGEVNSDQLEDPRYEALEPGDQVGKEGVEYAYDSLLRGSNGESRVQVDAAGEPTGGRLSEREPTTGNDLVLTIDDAVQSAGENAIGSIGLPGGFVAMNIHNGQLYGLGSSPGYDPSIFAKPRVPPVGLRRADRRGPRRAAGQPRHRRLLSHGLDLQADHGSGGARFG